MSRPESNRRWPILIAIIGIIASSRIVWTQRISEPATGPSVAWKQIASNATPADFVGNDTCRSCHRAEVTQFNKTFQSRGGCGFLQ
jgi:hypothetical protein